MRSFNAFQEPRIDMNIHHMPKAQADPVSIVSFRFVLTNKGQCSLL